MKNIAINNLEYTGIVTLSQYIDGQKKVIQKVHNTGCYSLFDFLANCLTGDFEIAKYGRPTKIRLLNKDANAQQIEAKSGFIYLLTKPERIYTDTVSVCYSFMIPRDFLQGNDFNCIGLYADNATDIDDFAAFCEVSFNISDITASSVLVVDWKLTVSNNNSDKN